MAARDGRLTITVPIQTKRRSGRKLVILPNGDAHGSRPWDGEPTPLQPTLARNHRRLSLLESSEVKNAAGACPEEGDGQQLCERMVNLTTLAPDIVAAILDETLAPDLTLFDLAVEPPALGGATSAARRG